MSFIGSGELEHKVTQLQRQLDHKDHELNSIKNEQRKSQEELSAAKRAKEDAEYKLRDEAERAHKSESAMNIKATEISQLKLKLSNLESSLSQTSDKLKKEEKEKDRVRDALDDALSSGADGAARQVRELAVRTKQLEEALKTAEQEKERMRSQGPGQGSSNDPWGSNEVLSRGERNKLMSLQNQVESLKQENERLQASSSKNASTDPFSTASPSKPRTKRRSMSVSGPTVASDMIELENQVAALKDQLVSRKRDLDKAVNEKLAAEIGARKKVEKLQANLDEVKEELDYYRSNGDSGDSKELEKVKKAMQADKDQLATKLKEKDEEIKSKVREIQSLEKVAEKVQHLEMEVEKERHAREQLEAAASSTPRIDDSESDSAAKIDTLEAELAKIKLQGQSGQASKSSVGEIRQVRRELQKAISEKEYLETLVKENDELLAEKDEEIERLRTAIPVPGSPSLAPRDDERIEELELEKVVLQDQLELQKEKFEEDVKVLQSKVVEVTENLKSVRSAEATLAAEVETLRQNLTTASSGRDDLQIELKEVLEQLAAKEAHVDEMATQLSQLRADIETLESASSSARAAAAEADKKHEETKASFAEKEGLLDELVQQRDQLELQLSQHKHSNEDFDMLVQSVSETETRLEGLQQSLQSVEVTKAELQSLVQNAQEGKEVLTAALAKSKVDLDEAQRNIHEAHNALENVQAENGDTVRALTEQVEDLKLDLSSAQLKLDDKIAELAVSDASQQEIQNRFEEAVKAMNELQDTVTSLEEAQANRSTESEAREKDEQLFVVQEEKRALEQALADAKQEYEDNRNASTFQAEQDLVEAKVRIASLEKRLEELEIALASASTPAEPPRQSKPADISEEEVRRFEQKLAQLRSERDELRHNLSFVQNERHFAVRALASEKESAVEEVKKAKDQLKTQVNLCEKLQNEVDQTRIALDEAKKASEEMVSAEERAQLANRLDDLEKELTTSVERVQELEKQLGQQQQTVESAESRATEAERRAEGLQKELLEMVHHVGQTAKLSDPPRPSTSPTDETGDLPSDLVATLEKGKRPSLGHTRSRSSVSASTMQNIMLEKQMMAKVLRRDARIAELTHDLEKANMNLTLVREAQEETLEEVAELTEEKERLEAQLQAVSQSQEDQSPQVGTETIRSFVLSLAIYRRHVKSAESNWVVKSDLLSTARSTVERLRESLVSAENKVDDGEARIASLEEEKSSIEARLNLAEEQVSASRLELSDAQDSITRLQSRLSTAEMAGESAAEVARSISTLEGQVEEKEERIRELILQNGELSSRLDMVEKNLVEATSVREEELQASTHEAQVATEQYEQSLEKIKALRMEQEGLMEEIAAAERALEDGMADAQSHRDVADNRTREVEAKIQEVERQLADKDLRLDEMAIKVDELKKLVEEADLTAKESEIAAQRDSATIDQLKQDLSTAQAASGENELVANQLRIQLADLQHNVKVVIDERDTLQAEINGLRSSSSTATQRLTDVEKEMNEVIAQLEQAEKAKGEVEGLINELRAEIVVAEHGQKDAQASLEETKVELVNMSNALAATREELVSSQQRAQEAAQDSSAKQADLDRLRGENLDLQDRLEKAMSAAAAIADTPVAGEASSDKVDEAVVGELQERIEQLEMSLSQKTEEVDEADDRTREAFKANSKLEKKIGKLQRQLEAAQVAANTALNKALSMPIQAPQVASAAAASAPSSAALPKRATPLSIVASPVEPIPSSSQSQTTSAAAVPRSSVPPTVKARVVSAPASTPSQTTTQQHPQAQTTRTPLSSVHNIFKSAPQAPPSSGHKRHRETDEVEFVKPAEAIMLPPSSTSPRRVGLGAGAKPRSGFTPQRGISNSHAHGPGTGGGNIFAPSTTSGTGQSTNTNKSSIHVFNPSSADPTGMSARAGVNPRQRSTVGLGNGPNFPLPPTRNVFEVAPK